MFKALSDVLKIIFVQFAETSYMRTVAAFAIIIPLVITMYGYMDQVIFDSKNALNTIATQTYDGFPIGSYFIAYLNVAQFDTFLTTIFGYICTAVVWSFTTDLQPALVRGVRK